MYRKNQIQRTSINVNQSTEGETIEQRVERIVNNKEPISDGAPRIYTERSEGVKAGYNVRTDRWEVAVEAMDKVDGTHKAKREEKAKLKAEKGGKGEENNGGAESTEGKG